MSQVARVFVVLNLLIAAGFLFAAATFLSVETNFKKDLKMEQAAHETTRTAKDAQISALQDQIKDLEATRTSLQEQKGRLQGEQEALTQQVQALNADKAELNSKLAEAAQTNASHAQNVSALRKDFEDMRKQVETLSAENRAKVKEATDAIAAKEKAEQTIIDLRNTISDHEKTITAANEKIEEQDLMIAWAKNQGLSFDAVENVPPVSGYVVNADNDMRLVQTNIGTEKGMVRGARLDIVRGDQYIGQMRVDEVSKNHSAGLLTIAPQGAMVQVGDMVTNKLH